MKIGFDFYKTLSSYPVQFKTLISSLVSEGHTIIVISALGPKSDVDNYKRHVIEFLKQHTITYHDFEVVVFQDDSEIPEIKLESCKRHQIDMYFDDREDVCQILNENKILCFKVGDKNQGNKSFFEKKISVK